MDGRADVGIELRRAISRDIFGEPGEQKDGEEGGGEAEQRKLCQLDGLRSVFRPRPVMMMGIARGQDRPRLRAGFFELVRLAIRLSSFARRAALPWRG